MLRGLDGYLLIPLFGLANFAVFKLRRGSAGGGRFAGFGGGFLGLRSLTFFGGHSEGETTLPISNRAVKPLRADGAWPSLAWESRSPPNYLELRAVPRGGP